MATGGLGLPAALAIGGFVGGFSGTLIQGGSIGQAFGMGFVGAFAGGVGGVAWGIGSTIGRIAALTAIGATAGASGSAIMGGNIGLGAAAGALGGFVAGSVGPSIAGMKGWGQFGAALGTAAATGAASAAIVGGSPGMGAALGAFGVLAYTGAAGAGYLGRVYGQMNPGEREFFWQHPVAGFKIWGAGERAFGLANFLIDRGWPAADNGPIGAIRHAAWGALSARSVGEGLATDFLTLHEEFIGNTTGQFNMDMANNRVGIALGVDPSKTSIPAEKVVIDAYRNDRLQTQVQ